MTAPLIASCLTPEALQVAAEGGLPARLPGALHELQFREGAQRWCVSTPVARSRGQGGRLSLQLLTQSPTRALLRAEDLQHRLRPLPLVGGHEERFRRSQER